jgi:NCS1 family nucleobase:cation symporter-1
MIVADYWLLRKKKWVVPDLFTPNGIYWFYHGWNLRCIAAMIIGMAPCIPGFIFICINSKTDNAWVKIYQITWFVAAPLSLCVYMGLNYVFPPEGLGRMELLPDGEESEVVEGVEVGKEGGVVSTKDKDREAQVGQTSSSASSSI